MIRRTAFSGWVWLLCTLLTTGMAEAAPIRLLLTFDDGPSLRERDNPTGRILDVLADNATQPGIRAVFFVHTRVDDRRGAVTRSLLRRIATEGHLLGLHSGAAPAWRTHPGLGPDLLAATLTDSAAELVRLGVTPAPLVRPPLWRFDPQSLGVYRQLGLGMLLTDVSARDGKSWGFRASPRRRGHLSREFERVAARVASGGLPIHDGVHPVLVTFHDTNTWTAAHFGEYLELLLEAARGAGLQLADPPFYSERGSITQAAAARAHDDQTDDRVVPAPWRWIWRAASP